jgi:caffeoyl-CoA O-methyltransferase
MTFSSSIVSAMSATTRTLPDALYRYYQSVAFNEPEVLRELRDATVTRPQGGMQISPEQGQFMQLLVRLMGARRCIEVGVFTGYSSTCVALALPDDGTLTACDVSAEWTAVARSFWEKAGVAHKITLQLAPAVETLDALLKDGRNETFDFAFINADKENYGNYFERALALTRRGGLIAIDNTLWSGRVADAADNSADTVAIREFNRAVHADRRVMATMLPIGDGLTLALKK